MDSDPLIERVRDAVAAAAAPLVPEIEMLSDSPPLLLAADAPILRHLTALVGQEEETSVSFATDAGWLALLGIDCAIWGPGTIAVAHKPNESLPKAELATARGFLETTVRHFCMETV
jgi:acetylornithine deacetylase